MLTWVVAAVLVAEPPGLAVMDLQVPGVDPAEALAVQESLTSTVARSGYFKVLSANEIRAMLGVERQRQLLGCSDASSSCEAELANALGSRFVLSGSLTKLGDALQLSLQLLDTQKGQVVARATRIAPTPRALIAQMPWTAAEATATPAPPQPSRALPLSLMGVGSAALIGGGVVGIMALTSDAALEQQLAASQPAGRLASFQRQAETNGMMRTISLVSLASGAALLALGITLFATQDVAVAMVPTASGFAFAGAWR